MSETPKCNHAVNHLGVNVPDLDAAAAWYTSVPGFQIIRPAFEIVAGESESGQRFAHINGPKFARCRVAYLAAGNGIGFEMFEFSEPRTERFGDDWEFWRPGIWYLCITAPDVAALAEAIAVSGGRHRSAALEAPPGSGLKLTYRQDPWGNPSQDPWGNPIELMNASYDRSVQAAR